MKTTLIRTAVVALLPLLSACTTPPESREDAYDQSTRASEEMAPANPQRGAKTIRVTTRAPAALEVRLLTFYSQFHPLPTQQRRLVPRSGTPDEGCWWSRTSLLQEERFYYTRVFHYPVGPGTQTQDLVLDEIVRGRCNLGITGVGYEVTLKTPDGKAANRYVQRMEIAIEEGAAKSADATIRCRLIPAQADPQRTLRCDREGKRAGALYVGPLASAGAALTLDFRLEDGASNRDRQGTD